MKGYWGACGARELPAAVCSSTFALLEQVPSSHHTQNTARSVRLHQQGQKSPTALHLTILYLLPVDQAKH